VRALLAAAAALIGVVVLGGCGGTGTPGPVAAPPTPIARLNTAAMSIPRIDFCTLVPDRAVVAAVDDTEWELDAYGNDDGTTARAWVFARPVDRAFARLVVADARREPGCTTPRGPGFGRPDVTQVCTDGEQVRVRHAGRFGDSWLSCEVTGTAARATIADRADAWCVEVANTLNTTE
jgi:hypothetical protein